MILLLLLTLSSGSGQAILHFDSLRDCELMRDRLLGLVAKAQGYAPFDFSVQGYCVVEEP